MREQNCLFVPVVTVKTICIKIKVLQSFEAAFENSVNPVA